MKIVDKVFGELQFDFTWYRYERVMFCGKEQEVVVLIAGDEDAEFEDGQYEAFKMLTSNWDNIQGEVLEKILNYYNSRREELGYDVGSDKVYPEILTVEELLGHISLVGVKIPYAEIYGGRSVGLTFDCTWDDENGVGVRLNDEEVVRVGFQDIAI